MFNRFLGVLALALMLALGANSARAQGALQVGGALTPGHLMMAYGNNFGMDAGGPTLAGGSPPNSTLPGTRPTGIAFVNSGLPVCAYSAYANLPYDSLCWGFDGQGNVLLQWGGLNGVAALPNLYFTPLGGASNFWLDTLGNPNGLTQPANDNSTKLASTAFVKGAVTSIANVRTRLTGTLTLYRSPTGVDSGGCTLASPCLTRNYVWNLLCNSYDLAGFNVTIQDADGTYTDDFHPQCQPVGNGSYTTITFQGHVGNQAAVIWSQAAGTTLEGGGAAAAPNLAIQYVTIKGNGTSTLITETQWSSLYLDKVTFGCNVGQRDINPSVESRLYLYAITIDKAACTFSTSVTTTNGSATLNLGATTNIAAGQYIIDPSNTCILPNTTVVSVNTGNSTAVLSQNAICNGSTTGYFAQCGLNFLQLDPGATVNWNGATFTVAANGTMPCYSQGFVSVANLAKLMHNVATVFNSNTGIGPPFVVYGGGLILAPSSAGLNYYPGQTRPVSGTFANNSSVMTVAVNDATWLNAYKTLLTGQQSIGASGSGKINPGTVITVPAASGTNEPLSLPTLAAGSSFAVTLGGQIASGGEYVTSSAIPSTPQATPYFSDRQSFTPVLQGSSTAGSPTYTTQNAYYQILGDKVEMTFAIAISAIGGMTGNLQISGLPITSSSATNDGQCTLANVAGWTGAAGNTVLTGLIAGNTNVIALEEYGSGHNLAPSAVSEFAAATTLEGHCVYWQ